MIDKKIFRYLLSTDGANQLERSPFALNPDTVKIDGRSKHDIARFLLALSEQIRYYNATNAPQGDWQLFLKGLTSGNEVLDDSAIDALFVAEKNCPPHLALLLAFLKAYRYLQDDLNQLTGRRLNFYYEDVLRILRRSAIGDQVHVIFELAKNASPVKLEKGTKLTAGTTTDGTPLLYQLDSEHVVTQAQIAMVSSDYMELKSADRRVIFKADDATVALGVGTGWRPFGKPQLGAPATEAVMQPALLGCAIGSPDFALAEGTRLVTVEFSLRPSVPVENDFKLLLNSMINVEMTSESGWITPDKISKAVLEEFLGSGGEKLYRLIIVSEFKDTSPAITGYQEAIHARRLSTSWPAWSMTAKPDAVMLERLSNFRITDIKTTVDVKGVRDLILQNEQSIQSPDAPIYPFGNAPRIGDRFYIGSKEAFSKSITEITLDLKWQDVPDSLPAHYSEYDNNNINNADFRGNLFLLGGKSWHLLNGTELPLFDSFGSDSSKTIFIAPAVLQNVLSYSPYKRNPKLTLENSFTQSTQQGFLKFVLEHPTKSDVLNLPTYAPFEAFGHKSFPAIYANHAIRIAKEEDIELPQPPYTPLLSSVTLNYKAVNSFKPEMPNLVDQFFSLDIFGAVESEEGTTVKVLPLEPHLGALYIGLSNAKPSQTVSILFQMEEGSTPGSTLLSSESITWSYLAGRAWKDISKGDILEDKTQGLQVPGLIRIILGPDATVDHTLMPSDMHWLRATINENADGVADILALHTQAARASLQLTSDTVFDEHLLSPLAAETIKSLSQKVPTIKKVLQPYPSFGGRSSESDNGYHQRTHERLRHRNRTVSTWDYERIVLENFPELFKVKALPHTDLENNLSPGHVKLVLVPDWRKRPSGNPLQPKANGALLKSIETFLTKNHASPFTTVHVTNPVYETLVVDCRISFHEGFDPGFYSIQLENELKRFLSPWAYEEGEDIVFGGKIYASEVMAFIEGRSYVDFITDFALYHRHEGKSFAGISEMQIDVDFIVSQSYEPTIDSSGLGKTIADDFVVGIAVDVAVATVPDAILVSSDAHRISVVTGDSCKSGQQIGIGQMAIGLDFILVS